MSDKAHERVTIAEFRRLDLRIGEVVAAAPIAGSDRLLKLTIDLGGETRTLVGGLGQSYTPESLCGRQVIVVANLVPADIRGVISEGMLLGVGCSDPRSVALLTVDRRTANGALVS